MCRQDTEEVAIVRSSDTSKCYSCCTMGPLRRTYCPDKHSDVIQKVETTDIVSELRLDSNSHTDQKETM